MLLVTQWLYRKMREGGSSAKPIEFQFDSEALTGVWGGFVTLQRTLFKVNQFFESAASTNSTTWAGMRVAEFMARGIEVALVR